MGIREAETAMSSLESSTNSFDYAKAELYFASVRAYVKEKHELFPNTPVLYDLSEGSVKLPPEFAERIEKWMLQHPEYSPYMRTFARNYIISFLIEPRGAKLYEHLADCVREGGDFYIECSFIYLREAGAVSAWEGEGRSF
jgi:hypothetical protein